MKASFNDNNINIHQNDEDKQKGLPISYMQYKNTIKNTQKINQTEFDINFNKEFSSEIKQVEKNYENIHYDIDYIKSKIFNLEKKLSIFFYLDNTLNPTQVSTIDYRSTGFENSIDNNNKRADQELSSICNFTKKTKNVLTWSNANNIDIKKSNNQLNLGSFKNSCSSNWNYLANEKLSAINSFRNPSPDDNDYLIKFSNNTNTNFEKYYNNKSLNNSQELISSYERKDYQNLNLNLNYEYPVKEGIYTYNNISNFDCKSRSKSTTGLKDKQQIKFSSKSQVKIKDGKDKVKLSKTPSKNQKLNKIESNKDNLKPNTKNPKKEKPKESSVDKKKKEEFSKLTEQINEMKLQKKQLNSTFKDNEIKIAQIQELTSNIANLKSKIKLNNKDMESSTFKRDNYHQVILSLQREIQSIKYELTQIDPFFQ